MNINCRAIRQTEIKDSGGMTFAEGVRTLLRQDPDVIFIGEIRDEETARMAIRASMTGHLVFTTFHTQNVFGVFPRLLDLKLSPALLEGNIKAIFSQRLLRKLCPSCKQRSIVDSRIIFTSKGCDYCHHTGYRGRTNITEILQITEEIETLINTQAPMSQLRHKATSEGFQDLRYVAQQNVYAGETSWDEFYRVLGKSQ
ncbi:MAG: GspE/PulE family protein [Janthinobacterium lividum]